MNEKLTPVIVAHAKQLFDARDYTAAVPLFRQAASEGNTEAMVYLGRVYSSLGVTRDIKEASSWYSKAAGLGSVDGLYWMGQSYSGRAGHNPAEATKWFRRARRCRFGGGYEGSRSRLWRRLGLWRGF